jgi:hypothetical protein
VTTRYNEIGCLNISQGNTTTKNLKIIFSQHGSAGDGEAGQYTPSNKKIGIGDLI